MRLPVVFTIILNYRHADDTLRCVASVRESDYRRQHLIVVDNGSPPGVVEELRAGLPATALLENGANLGFGAGNNAGIRYALAAEADLVWILNPDTIVEPGTLRRLVETMLRHSDVGIAGAKIFSGRTEEPTIWFIGGTIDWQRGGKPAHPFMWRKEADVRIRDVRQVEYVTGACMLVRRQVFDQIGLLPEDYFLYFEETDFNVRAQRAGWKCVVDPRARLVHYQRSKGVLPGAAYVYYYTRNRLIFGKRFSPVPEEMILRDVEGFTGDWREQVSKRDPGWLANFDELVTWAIEDGRAGRTGRREGVEDLQSRLALSAGVNPAG